MRDLWNIAEGRSGFKSELWRDRDWAGCQDRNRELLLLLQMVPHLDFTLVASFDQ